MEYVKPNPFAISRPAREVRELILTDSNHPEMVVCMKLRELDSIDSSNAENMQKSLVRKYINSDIPFPPVGGESLVLNADICFNASVLYYAQCGTEEEKFTVEELIAFSVAAPEIWCKLLYTINELSESSAWGKALRITETP